MRREQLRDGWQGLGWKKDAPRSGGCRIEVRRNQVCGQRVGGKNHVTEVELWGPRQLQTVGRGKNDSSQ